MKANTKVLMGIFVLVGVVLVNYFNVPNSQILSDPDTGAYVDTANKLAVFDWQGYKNGVRPLGYPLLLLVVQKFGLNYFSTVLILNYIGLICLFLAFKKYTDWQTSLLILFAGGMMFFSKMNFQFEKYYLTESICLLMMCAALAVLLKTFLVKPGQNRKIAELLVLYVVLTQIKPIFLVAFLPTLVVCLLFLIKGKKVWLGLAVVAGVFGFNVALLPKWNYTVARYNMIGNYSTLEIERHFLDSELRHKFNEEEIKTLEQLRICGQIKNEKPRTDEASPYYCAKQGLKDETILGRVNGLTISMFKADPIYLVSVFAQKTGNDFRVNILDFGTIVGLVRGNVFLYRLFFVLTVMSLVYWFMVLNKKRNKKMTGLIVAAELLFISLFLVSSINLNEDFGLKRVLLPAFMVYVLINSFVIFTVLNDVLGRLSVYIYDNGRKEKHS